MSVDWAVAWTAAYARVTQFTPSSVIASIDRSACGVSQVPRMPVQPQVMPQTGASKVALTGRPGPSGAHGCRERACRRPLPRGGGSGEPRRSDGHPRERVARSELALQHEGGATDGGRLGGVRGDDDVDRVARAAEERAGELVADGRDVQRARDRERRPGEDDQVDVEDVGQRLGG